MNRLFKPLFLVLLLHFALNLQAQELRTSIETGEDLPSFYPYLGFEWEGNKSIIDMPGQLRYMVGTRYYPGDKWNFEAEYGRDMVMQKTSVAKRRQISRLGAARMLFGGLKTEAIDNHYTSSKIAGLNIRSGVEHRVEQVDANIMSSDFYLYKIKEEHSYSLTSAYLGVEFMVRKKRKSLDINIFRGVSVNQRGWNQHLYFDVFLLSFLSDDAIEMSIYKSDSDDIYYYYTDNWTLVSEVTLYGPVGKYSPFDLKKTGTRLGYSLVTFNPNGSSHRIGAEVALPPWIYVKGTNEEALTNGAYFKLYYTSTLPLF